MYFVHLYILYYNTEIIFFKEATPCRTHAEKIKVSKYSSSFDSVIAIFGSRLVRWPFFLLKEIQVFFVYSIPKFTAISDI